MYLVSPRDSTLICCTTIIDCIPKIFRPTGKLLVFQISSSSYKRTHVSVSIVSPMSPQALCAVGSPLSVSWFLPAEVSGIDLWSSSLEVGNPLHQLMVSQSYALFCREHQASSLVHTMCILYSCKCQYHPIPTSVVSASKCTRVPLGNFRFALALPIKANSLEGSHSVSIFGFETNFTGRWGNNGVCIFLHRVAL